MSRSRWFDAAAVVVTIAILVGLGVVVRGHATPVIDVSAADAHVNRPAPALPTAPLALFIGDSYTAGTGAQETSYGCTAATKMAWLCRVSAMPGTGYISGGPGNRFVVNEYIGESRSISERLPGLAARYDPAIVVLDGGRNDVFAPPDAELEAMVSTIDDVHRTWPAASVAVIRPRFLARPGDDLGYGDDFLAALQADPRAHDVRVIDPIGSLSSSDTSDLLQDDGIHPNEYGESVMTAALIGSLQSSGIAVPV